MIPNPRDPCRKHQPDARDMFLAPPIPTLIPPVPDIQTARNGLYQPPTVRWTDDPSPLPYTTFVGGDPPGDPPHAFMLYALRAPAVYRLTFIGFDAVQPPGWTLLTAQTIAVWADSHASPIWLPLPDPPPYKCSQPPPWTPTDWGQHIDIDCTLWRATHLVISAAGTLHARRDDLESTTNFSWTRLEKL